MDFTAALGVLQGLLPLEEDDSGSKGQAGQISQADLNILCAEGLPACGSSFWAACTDVKIDIRALNRWEHHSGCRHERRYLKYLW